MVKFVEFSLCHCEERNDEAILVGPIKIAAGRVFWGHNT